MTEVQRLPYREPLPMLTATARSRSLEAHYAGFMAANQTDSTRHDDYPLAEAETVADLVLFVGLKEYISFRELKRCAKRVRRLTKGALGFGQGVELLSRAMGYKTYAAVCALNPGRVLIRTLRTGPPIQFSMDLITSKRST